MVASSLKDISLASSSRLASASVAATKTRAARAVRWGAAVAEPARRGGNNCRYEGNAIHAPGSEMAACRPTVRRVAVSLDEACKVATAIQASAAPAETSSFTQNRIRHALELFGACMMIVTFLAMAIFA
jgi:hypothetical protein